MRLFRRARPEPPVPAVADSPVYGPSSVTSPVALQAWLNTELAGRDTTVRDAGWAWWVTADSALYLVVKRDGSVWPLDPANHALLGATDEADFHDVWRRTRGTEPFPDHWIGAR